MGKTASRLASPFCRTHPGNEDWQLLFVLQPDQIVLLSQSRFLRHIEYNVFEVSLSNERVCRQRMRGMAIVSLDMSRENIMQFRRKLRVTFADQVANFGMSGCVYNSCICSLYEVMAGVGLEEGLQEL